MPFAVTSLTLTPQAWPGALQASLLGTSLESGLWTLETVDLRAFGLGKHQIDDDTPAGGGPGMVMRPDVAAAAIDSVTLAGRPLIYLTPRGRPIQQQQVKDWAAGPGLVLFCGRFEGLDERVIESRNMVEICVGDVVLTGGDLPAQILTEACVRLQPGFMGNQDSVGDESFEAGLLEHPLYTKPRDFEGRPIPDVLLSGDHGKIRKWKAQQARADTARRRPDLWAAFQGDKP